jgi:hypothetical protein
MLLHPTAWIHQSTARSPPGRHASSSRPCSLCTIPIPTRMAAKLSDSVRCKHTGSTARSSSASEMRRDGTGRSAHARERLSRRGPTARGIRASVARRAGAKANKWEVWAADRCTAAQRKHVMCRLFDIGLWAIEMCICDFACLFLCFWLSAVGSIYDVVVSIILSSSHTLLLFFPLEDILSMIIALQAGGTYGSA